MAALPRGCKEKMWSFLCFLLMLENNYMFFIIPSRGKTDLCSTGTYVGYQILLAIAFEDVPWSFPKLGTWTWERNQKEKGLTSTASPFLIILTSYSKGSMSSHEKYKAPSRLRKRARWYFFGSIWITYANIRKILMIEILEGIEDVQYAVLPITIINLPIVSQCLPGNGQCSPSRWWRCSRECLSSFPPFQ